MSQIAKRPAADAFDGDGDADSVGKSTKKRRMRKRTGRESHGNVAATTPSKDKQDASSPARPKDFTAAEDSVSFPEVKHQATHKSSKTTPRQPTKSQALVMSSKQRRHGKSRADKKPNKVKTAKRRHSLDPGAWSVSAASGGVFIEHDPVFTADGRHILVPTKDSVNVYSLKTSLLVRSIHVKDKDTICSCYIPPSHPQRIVVATRGGLLVEYDWTTGSKISKWQTRTGLVTVAGVRNSDDGKEIVAVRSAEHGGDELLLLSAQPGQKEVKAKVLIRDPNLHKTVFISPDASHIVVCGNEAVHVGMLERKSTEVSGQVTPYTWYKLPVSGPVSSFDVRFSPMHSTSSKKPLPVDIVLGLLNGQIHIYENVVSKLIQKVKNGQAPDLNGRKLHWHRGLVRGVKWSRDGNYLISGGDESVLVLWQLETNQQQYLPHLSTAILNITVSLSGSVYALRLADNSVMVISTADLTPSTNITGLSLPNYRQDVAPVLMHPARANQLIAATPTRSIGGSKLSSNAVTHLQTFDIQSSLQLGRQALTRNLTTAVNVAPNGQILQEPSVIHMEISFDGQWLATVEKWTPSDSDIEAMYLNGDDQLAKQQLTETILRFWSWNAEDSSWDLTNRIDEPHPASKFSVLALASNPATAEFSTTGEDGTVRIWRPARRTRDGLQVKHKSGSVLFNWTCAQIIRIEKSLIDARQITQASGTLAYSDDGSVLAASLSSKQRYVHLLDPRRGAICTSQPNLITEGQASLAISGRSLLCLSHDFQIFDLVNLQPTFTMSLPSHQKSFLALNARSKSVAIGISSEERRHSSTVTMIDLDGVRHSLNTTIDISGQLRTVLSEPLDRGFVVIDTDCRIRKLTPPGGSTATALTALTHPVTTSEQGTQMKNFEDLFGRDQTQIHGNEADRQQQKTIENISSSGSLSDLFSGGANSISGQLGVNELFERVSRAVSGPRTQVSAMA